MSATWSWRRTAVGILTTGVCGLAGTRSTVAQVASPIPPAQRTAPAVRMAPAVRTALVGATVIDGTGARPLRDATVVLEGRRILAVGPRRSVPVPPDATTIDARGLFVLPGFIDTFGNGDSTELKYGVTTSGGWPREDPDRLFPRQVMWFARFFDPMMSDVPGLRGSTVIDTTLFAADNVNDVEDHLIGLDLDSLRVVVGRVLDLGYVDDRGKRWKFAAMKYGATAHANGLIPFSTAAQRVMIEEAHKRGMRAIIHGTGIEGLRMAVLAGVDNIVHANENEDVHTNRGLGQPWPDDLLRLIARRGTVCMLMPLHYVYVNYLTSDSKINARRMIQGGCTIAVMTHGYVGERGFIQSVVWLVTDGGMTPMNAIVAATRNGARAFNGEAQYGTVTAGKAADLVVLDADPLRDIRNIARTVIVFREGRRIDVDRSERDRALGPW